MLDSIDSANEILEWNKHHDNPNDILQAVKGLSYSQVQSLALSLVWKIMNSKKRFDNLPAKLMVKREVARAYFRPPYNLKKEVRHG
jgi:hypothetical protein